MIAEGIPERVALKRVIAGSRDHSRVHMDWKEASDQELDANSVLSFYRELIALRGRAPALIYGALTFLDLKSKALFNYTRILSPGGENFYIEVNLSPRSRPSVALGGAEFLLGNYGTGTGEKLRPYEARIYKI